MPSVNYRVTIGDEDVPVSNLSYPLSPVSTGEAPTFSIEMPNVHGYQARRYYAGKMVKIYRLGASDGAHGKLRFAGRIEDVTISTEPDKNSLTLSGPDYWFDRLMTKWCHVYRVNNGDFAPPINAWEFGRFLEGDDTLRDGLRPDEIIRQIIGTRLYYQEFFTNLDAGDTSSLTKTYDVIVKTKTDGTGDGVLQLSPNGTGYKIVGEFQSVQLMNGPRAVAAMGAVTSVTAIANITFPAATNVQIRFSRDGGATWNTGGYVNLTTPVDGDLYTVAAQTFADTTEKSNLVYQLKLTGNASVTPSVDYIKIVATTESDTGLYEGEIDVYSPTVEPVTTFAANASIGDTNLTLTLPTVLKKGDTIRIKPDDILSDCRVRDYNGSTFYLESPLTSNVVAGNDVLRSAGTALVAINLVGQNRAGALEAVRKTTVNGEANATSPYWDLRIGPDGRVDFKRTIGAFIHLPDSPTWRLGNRNANTTVVRRRVDARIGNNLIGKGAGTEPYSLTLSGDAYRDVDSVALYGERILTYTDTSITDIPTLDNKLRAAMLYYKSERESIEIAGKDYFGVLETGDIIELDDEIVDTTQRFRIMTLDMSWDSSTGEESFSAVLQNKPVGISNILDAMSQEVANQVNIQQGAVTGNQTSGVSVRFGKDQDGGLISGKYMLTIDDERAQRLMLYLRTEAFDAYEKGIGNAASSATTSGSGGGATSGSGGGSTVTSASGGSSSVSSSSAGGAVTSGGASNLYTHPADGTPSHQHYMDHSHIVPDSTHTHTVVIPAHTHSVTVADHTHTIPAHTHSVTIPEHAHAMQFGIFQFKGDTPGATVVYPSKLRVYIGDDNKTDGFAHNAFGEFGSQTAPVEIRADISDARKANGSPVFKDSNGRFIPGMYAIYIVPSAGDTNNANGLGKVHIAHVAEMQRMG